MKGYLCALFQHNPVWPWQWAGKTRHSIGSKFFYISVWNFEPWNSSVNIPYAFYTWDESPQDSTYVALMSNKSFDPWTPVKHFTDEEIKQKSLKSLTWLEVLAASLRRWGILLFWVPRAVPLDLHSSFIQHIATAIFSILRVDRDRHTRTFSCS